MPEWIVAGGIYAGCPRIDVHFLKLYLLVVHGAPVMSVAYYKCFRGGTNYIQLRVVPLLLLWCVFVKISCGDPEYD